MDSLLPIPGEYPIFDLIHGQLNADQRRTERRRDYIHIWSVHSFLKKMIKKGITYKQLAKAWQQEFAASVAAPSYLKEFYSVKGIIKKIIKKRK